MSKKDSRAEHFLTEFGMSWKWQNDLTWAMLKPDWDRVNWGRPGAKARVEEAVLQYAMRVENGSEMIGGIYWGNAPGGMEVLDGVQRLLAEQLLKTTRFSGYVCTIESELTARVIRVMANNKIQGCFQESSEWNRQQAIQMLIIEGGMSVEEIARLGSWKVDDVRADKDYLEWGHGIRCIGGPDRLTKGITLHIAQNAKMDDLRIAPKPISEFCHDLKRGKFSNGDSLPHIKSFFHVQRKKANLHNQFAKKLDHFHADPDVRARLDGRKRSGLNHDINLRRSLKATLTTTEEILAGGIAIPFMDEFFQLWNRVEKNLKIIAKQSKATAAR